VLRNQQILRFDVPVNDVIGVHVGKSLDKLIHNIFNELGFEAVGGLFEYFEQVILNILKDEVDDTFSPEGISELNDVGVFHIFEYFDLAHGDFADEFIVFRLLELFDGEGLLGLVGLAFEDDAVCALTDDRENLIFLHNV
jgi:hypothetical protein